MHEFIELKNYEISLLFKIGYENLNVPLFFYFSFLPLRDP
jgi:hypothetical protein